MVSINMYQNLRNRTWLKNLSLLQTAGTFPLPDLSDCILPAGRCSCMTPQGICATNHYILVTAYCNIRRFQKDLQHADQTAACKGTQMPRSLSLITFSFCELQHLSRKCRSSQNRKVNYDSFPRSDIMTEQVHPSCLFVYDKKTKVRLATLELPDHNHVGGITFDGSRIWIAKSTDKALSMITEQDLGQAVQTAARSSSAPVAPLRYTKKTISCDMIASFLTWFEGRIWIGYCAPAGKKGVLRSFQIQKRTSPNGTKELHLLPDQELSIPAKANGGTFYTDQVNHSTFLFLNLSGGRTRTSRLFVYQIKEGNAHTIRKRKKRRLLLPPLMEESCLDKNCLYTLFESSSPAYRDVPGNCCPFPVDVVSMCDPKILLR